MQDRLILKKSTKLIAVIFSAVTLLCRCSNDDLSIEKNEPLVESKNASTTNCSLEGVSTSNRIRKTDAYHTYAVNTLATLQRAINGASEGDVIYIEDNAIIDTQRDSLIIDKPITLASGRGINNSCGALIKTNIYGIRNVPADKWLNNSSHLNSPFLVIKSSGVTITGIRFRGPFGDIESDDTKLKLKKGISIFNPSENITINNCELYNFPYHAIGIEENVNNEIIIENNYFHNNRQHHYGYGIAVNGKDSFALVTDNTFEENRHDIACEGRQGSGYEFSYNEIQGNNLYPNIDVHGGKDFGGQDGSQKIAGTFFYVHHNTFKDYGQNARNILVRGIPEVMFLVENNSFTKTNKGNVFFIDEEKLADGTNVFSFNNSYGGFVKDYIFPKEYYHNVSDITYLPIKNTGENILNMMDVACGDFDDNKQSDIFINRNGSWYYINYPKPETMHIRENFNAYKWTKLASSGYQPKDVKIADFNGDGKTDVFSTSAGYWQIAYAGNFSAGWQRVNYSPDYTIRNLKFGDFDGDGKTDAFKTKGRVGKDWSISRGATTRWVKIGSSSNDISELRIGKFSNNPTTDVFHSNNVQWFYADKENGMRFQHLAYSREHRDVLFAADLNNDGFTDIYKKHGSRDEDGYQVARKCKGYVWENVVLDILDKDKCN